MCMHKVKHNECVADLTAPSWRFRWRASSLVAPTLNFVRALNHASRKHTRSYKFESDVRLQWPKQSDSRPDKYWKLAHDQFVNEVGAQESLDSLAAIHIKAKETALGKPVHDLLGRTSHGLDLFLQLRRNLEGPVRQDDDRLLVRPSSKSQNLLEGFPAHDDGVDACHKAVVPIVATAFAARPLHPIQVAIRPGDEPVQTRSDEHGHLATDAALGLVHCLITPEEVL
jgi:hypothetical protein